MCRRLCASATNGQISMINRQLCRIFKEKSPMYKIGPFLQ
ncbi:hypothetical protein CNEO4_1270005 [Clostridium neonatale]|nr:hypothetical protein CNEO3_1520002 [Clostridium neonatale]CAI3583954.1 hypothetical protein CNEO4_1270005 [Clostridium neonatale]CAI3596223.1 hypothetical protein CNEO4_1690001 [Clostridium neonatale]CAI3606493.1 hypothetical protein CNEO4_1360003 [Clostridium neonatale]